MEDPLAGYQPVESLDEGSPPRSDEEVDPLKLIDTQVMESYEKYFNKRYQDARPQITPSGVLLIISNQTNEIVYAYNSGRWSEFKQVESLEKK